VDHFPNSQAKRSGGGKRPGFDRAIKGQIAGVVMKGQEAVHAASCENAEKKKKKKMK